jgi:hypothetical protein
MCERIRLGGSLFESFFLKGRRYENLQLFDFDRGNCRLNRVRDGSELIHDFPFRLLRFYKEGHGCWVVHI